MLQQFSCEISHQITSGRSSSLVYKNRNNINLQRRSAYKDESHILELLLRQSKVVLHEIEKLLIISFGDSGVFHHQSTVPDKSICSLKHGRNTIQSLGPRTTTDRGPMRTFCASCLAARLVGSLKKTSRSTTGSEVMLSWSLVDAISIVVCKDVGG